VVDGTAAQPTEITAVEAWYTGHKDVKFLYSVDDETPVAVADTIKKYNLKGKSGLGLGRGGPGAASVKDGDLTSPSTSRPTCRGSSRRFSCSCTRYLPD